MHYHHCPECYETYECNFDCTIEPDLGDEGKDFGAHYACFACKPVEGFDNKGNKLEQSPEQWFRRYNGFRDKTAKESRIKNPYTPFTSEWWLRYNGFI